MGMRIPNRDPDGDQFVRIKVNTTGFTYQARSIEFSTSTLNSVTNQNHDGTDWGDATLTLYDASDNVITDQTTADTSCVKTVLDWEPTYNYDLIGGKLAAKALITQDARIWCVGVPDIPANQGGSKVMISGLNLAFLTEKQQIELDGRTAKLMTYDATYHTNKMRKIIKHTAGAKYDIEVIWEHFKP